MKEWLKKLLSSNELASFSRTGAAVSLIIFLSLDIFTVLWAALYLHRPMMLPGRDNLIGQAVFVAAIYSPGKAGETISKFAASRVP